MSKKRVNSFLLMEFIKEDLEQKMVFLGGPRQVGKTTLAQGLIPDYQDQHPAYIHWDCDVDRARCSKRQRP